MDALTTSFCWYKVCMDRASHIFGVECYSTLHQKNFPTAFVDFRAQLVISYFSLITVMYSTYTLENFTSWIESLSKCYIYVSNTLHGSDKHHLSALLDYHTHNTNGIQMYMFK